VLLKFFELEARFPRAASDMPPGAVPYVAEQVGVPAARFADYWQAARAVKRHRVEIRGVFGFREATRADEETLTAWLAEEVCPVELGADGLVDAVLVRCRALQIEPPGRIERIVGSARARFEQRFCAQTVERLGSRCVARLEALVDEEAVGLSGQGLLAQLKADPRRVGLETLLREIDKLAAVRGLELPADLFADCSEKLVDAWRARAARLYPSDLRASPVPIRLTLLGALCRKRQSEITDALVDLLIGLVHKVNATAEQRVEKTLTDDLKRVRGKHGILFRLAAAAVEQPDETVRRALFPVVGEGTLRDLVREAEASNRERRTMGWLDEGRDGCRPPRRSPTSLLRSRSTGVCRAVSLVPCRRRHPSRRCSAVSRSSTTASGSCGSGTGRTLRRTRSLSAGRSIGSDGGRSPVPRGGRARDPGRPERAASQARSMSCSP
jgi:hypothetical protein